MAEQAPLDAATRVVSRDIQHAFPDGCDRGAYARDQRTKKQKGCFEMNGITIMLIVLVVIVAVQGVKKLFGKEETEAAVQG